jgi:hypothetical protein
MKKVLGIIVLTLAITGCSGDNEQSEIQQLQQQNQQLQQQQLQQQQIQPQAQYQPQNQPVIVQAAPAQQESHAMQDMMIGGLIGHAMSGGSSNNSNYSQPSRTIVNRTIINKTVVSRPSSFSTRSAYKSSARRK